jgi:multiple sugar transport system substrate-binding protein
MGQWGKKAAMLLLTAFLAISVTACGGNGTASTGNAELSANKGTADSTATAKPVKLRITWWGAQLRHDATLKVLDLYTKEHPNVTFEPEFAGWDGYWDKLNTEIAAKQAPDIIQMDATVIDQYVANNQLAELAQVNTKDMEPALLNTGKVNGKLYAIPLGNNINGMAYNKSAIEKLGLTAPKYDWTWDDYFQFGRDAQAKLGKGKKFALMDNTLNNEVYNMYQISQGKGYMITNDGKFNLDKDSFIKFMTIQSQLRKEGVVPPAEVTVANVDLDPQNDLLVNGTVLVKQLYAAMFTALDSLSPGTFAMVSVPKAQEKGGWLTPSMYWSVGSKSPNAEEAQKFIDWFINDKDAADILGTTRGVPVSSQVLDHLSPKFTDADKVGIDLLTNASSNAPSIPFTPGGWAGFGKDYSTVTEKLLFDKITPEEAYNELVEKAKQYQ